MEEYYKLMVEQKWSELFLKAKSEQVFLKKYKNEWDTVCGFLEKEFLRYAKNEKPVLIGNLCFQYIKLHIAGYVQLTDESRLEIENLGINAFEVQNSNELKSFLSICKFAKKIEKSDSEEIIGSDKQSVENKLPSFPRTDWLNPLFKSNLENHFYEALKEVFPQFFIYPNVAISNIFDKDNIFPHLDEEQRNFYFKGVVDFVVYNPTDGYTPKYFFEVDSFYHDRHEQIIRDNKKNSIFKAASITLYRVRPFSDSLTTKHDFIVEIRKILKESTR